MAVDLDSSIRLFVLGARHTSVHDALRRVLFATIEDNPRTDMFDNIFWFYNETLCDMSGELLTSLRD